MDSVSHQEKKTARYENTANLFQNGLYTTSSFRTAPTAPERVNQTFDHSQEHSTDDPCTYTPHPCKSLCAGQTLLLQRETEDSWREREQTEIEREVDRERQTETGQCNDEEGFCLSVRDG